MNVADILVLLSFVLMIGSIVFAVMNALRLKNTVMGTVGRVKPLVGRGKTVVATGRREFEQNRERVQSLTGEVKDLVAALRPSSGEMAARTEMRLRYRDLMRLLGVLGAVRRTLKQARVYLKPTSNPSGPKLAKHKAAPRRLGVLGLAPDIVRLVRDVQRELRRP